MAGAETQLKDERDRAQQALAAWYHNPYLMMALGAASGLILVNVVRR